MMTPTKESFTEALKKIDPDDGTFLWAFKHIPIVTTGAGDRQVPHQINEWIDLDQLIETAKVYALTALHYLFAG